MVDALMHAAKPPKRPSLKAWAEGAVESSTTSAHSHHDATCDHGLRSFLILQRDNYILESATHSQRPTLKLLTSEVRIVTVKRASLADSESILVFE